MKILHKLILSFLAVATLICLIGYFSLVAGRKALQKSIVDNSTTLGIKILSEIERNIHSRLEIFQEYCKDLTLVETVSESNREFGKLDNIQAYITDKDKEWTSVSEEAITPFMQELFNNRLSEELRAKADFYEEKYGYKVFGEIFVTNKYGANIAQTGKTTDYRQDDEKWWQEAKINGSCVTDVSYDQSSDVHCTDIGTRIDDKNGNFIGVIKAVLNIEEMINIIKELKSDKTHIGYSTIHFTLTTRDGKSIYSTKGFELSQDIPHLFQDIESSERGGLDYIIREGHEPGEGQRLFVHTHSRGYKDFKGLGWVLIIDYETEEILTPLTKLRNGILVASLAMAAFAILIGFLFSRSVAAPILKLRSAAAEIGKGKLDTKIDVGSNDEIGQLADSFRRMTKDLRETTTSIDELSKEIANRKRIEAEFLEKQAALKAQNISTVRKSIELSDIKRELEDKNYDLELSRTELEKAMEALRKARDELEMRVEERTIELAKANRNLQAEINERKGTEEALRESREQLRATLESTGDGILVVNKMGQVTHTNTHFAQMWRIPMEVIKTKDDDKLLNYVLDQLQKPQEFLSKVKELYESWKEDTDTLFFKDGRVFERYSCPLIRDGRIDGRVWSFRDLTERKRMEQERKKLEAHLRRAEKMEALGTLAGGVAHDLNNILSGLISYPELLLMDLAEDSPLRRPILTIQSSGKKAAAIVQDLLTLARRGVSTTEVVNMNDIITDYFRSPEYEKLKAFHRRVEFKANLETDLLNTLGSSVHLSKTVMNLSSNAAEAQPDGGMVTISTRNQYVDKPIKGYDEVKEGDYAVLSVADNGIGISAGDLEKVFEPFYTKKTMGKSGTGLGMAVVWGTVKDHNGYIDVQSTVGKGTTFDLYFPVTRKEAEERKSALSIEEYMGDGETILVVDDVQEQREIASVLLSKLGYSVNAVSSGEEAVDYMKTSSADLLVIDMIMDPGIDGLETYRRIIELHPGQKAIIASGYSETDRVKEAQRLGAGQYVKKPYTLERIGLTVKAELEK